MNYSNVWPSAPKMSKDADLKKLRSSVDLTVTHVFAPKCQTEIDSILINHKLSNPSEYYIKKCGAILKINQPGHFIEVMKIISTLALSGIKTYPLNGPIDYIYGEIVQSKTYLVGNTLAGFAPCDFYIYDAYYEGANIKLRGYSSDHKQIEQWRAL